MIPLFKTYQALNERLPYVSLGVFPSPVKKLEYLGSALGMDNIYIKDDGGIGIPFGGNKVRKLEFLLGKAVNKKASGILTFGYAGSNHTLATTIYAKRFSIPCTSMLLPQPNAHYVRKNLLLCLKYKGKMLPCKNLSLLIIRSFSYLVACRIRRHCFPQIIPAGGTSILGILGYVNAALELKEQIQCGILPKPEYLYIAGGTMGTAVGLILGLNAAGLHPRIHIVKITHSPLVGMGMIRRLFNRTCAFLRTLDPSFPNCNFQNSTLTIRKEFLGDGYAFFTDQGMEAVKLMKELEAVPLEGTYTGKTLAALIHDARIRAISKRTILFWNTYNTRDCSEIIEDIDYRGLPVPLHRYFEEEVQPRDRRNGPRAPASPLE